ncbi:PRC-barrel domain-containing protein [Pigmentiphaga litoralis]|uniref:Sporulation protein YlmC with PRC-barrel domain n=1 Tax=Pigmentiphaga litoralis TaxID=516702 RepID=A0A7Y9IQ17_9BURK|nr:PRC-barrel domain-containing protein [Pigmentiphaga litoralis]NYE25498.1 sporulation protein YlmC with PRC-barrel domain [Pigmentiphaga litoralis]NYE80890.1 sporulation protein YlmC with PRC-barrel domain [Pigmentiphaga litoralis]
MLATGVFVMACLATSSYAQVAGSMSLGKAFTDLDQPAPGWSVKKSLLGKPVYNESGERLGKVEDLIIDPAKSVSYLIVSAGGFIGVGKHDVAIEATKIREQQGRLVLPGATKDLVKAMPAFSYATKADAK